MGEHKDFSCLNIVEGKYLNIEGLELHTGVFNRFE